MNCNQETSARNMKWFYSKLSHIHCTRKRRSRGIGLIGGILLACLFGMLAPGAGEKICSQAKMLTQGNEKFRYTTYQVDDIEVKIHVGLSANNMRVGRYAPAHLILKNNGKDFEGGFRFYPDGQAVVEKKIQIAAGETKEYSCIVSCYMAQLQTALYDKKGKLLKGNDLKEQVVTLGEYEGGKTVLGLISENDSALAYLANQDDVIAEPVQDFMLNGDWRMLDSLDVLVINQFDTTQFSEKQITAINEWVRLGGTLIFGTGTQPEKTLKAFSGNLLQGTIGSAKKVDTQYGKNLDISEIQLENMKSLLSQDDDLLVGQMDYGKGSVMVASFDLAGDMGDKLKSVIQNLWYLNMSMDRKRQIQLVEDTMLEDDRYDDYEFSLGDALDATEVNGLPNIMLYAVLLLLYAIFIGPVLYSILRKRGKRERLWILIPVSAVVCSVLIYLIGTGTRVKHPYMNYVSEIDLSSEGAPGIQTYLRITSPNNDSFALEVPEKNIMEYELNEDYYRSSESSSLDYKNRMEYLEDQTVLHMDNLSAFDSVYFRQKQEVKQQGRIQFADINLENNNALQGIVTNQSEYDLEQCALIINGEVLVLGDLKRGESISLDQLDVLKSWVQDHGYNTAAAKVTGYDLSVYHNSDVQGFRRTTMLQRRIEMEGSFGGCYFYGFLASDQSTAFTDQYDVDLYGVTAVVQRLDSNDLGGTATDRISNLDVLAIDLPTDYNSDRGLRAKDYTVNYDLEGLGLPDFLQLSYQRSGNKEFDLLEELQNSPEDASYEYLGEHLFLGTVLAVNQQTGEQEVIFTAGEENVVTDLTKYIDKNNNLQLIYRIEALDEKQYPNQDEYYSSFGLPILYLERRSGS